MNLFIKSVLSTILATTSLNSSPTTIPQTVSSSSDYRTLFLVAAGGAMVGTGIYLLSKKNQTRLSKISSTIGGCALISTGALTAILLSNIVFFITELFDHACDEYGII